MRLYYVQRLIVDQDEKNLTLTFTLEDELKLKFNDLETLETWRKGLESQISALLAPDGRLSSGPVTKLSGTDISGKDQISTDNVRWTENRSLSTDSGTYLNQGKRGEKTNLKSGQFMKLAQLGSWLHMPGVVYPRKEVAPDKPRFLSEKYKLKKLESLNSDYEAKIISNTDNTKPRKRQQTWLPFLRNSEGRRNMSYGLQRKDFEVNFDGQKLMITVGTQTEEEDIAVGFGTGTDENFMAVNGSFSMQKMPRTSSMSPQHIARSGSNIDLFHGSNSSQNGKKAETYQFDADIASHYASMFSGATADSFASLGDHSPARPDVYHKNDSSRRINKSVSWSPSISQVSKLSLFSTNTCSSPGSSSVGETASSPSSQLSAVMLPVEVIELEELVFGRILGSGSEGAVQAAWYRETPVAVKSFNRMEDSAHEVSSKGFLEDTAIFRF